MPHSDKHAKRLLREFQSKLPEATEQVLERPCYWDPGFCDLFLDLCEETTFNDPEAGLKLARLGPQLAQAVPEAPGPEGPRKHRERVVRGYLLLGSAYRAMTRYEEAENAYRAAFRLCDRRVSGSCWAELDQRVAYLRACQGHFKKALKLVTRAEGRFKAAKNEIGAGTAAVIHGAILIQAEAFSQAVSVLSEALASCRLDPRSEYSATHNLADAVSKADDPDQLRGAVEHLQRARRLLSPRRSVQKCRLYWIEARILIRLGRMDQGEQRYRKALAGLIQFGVPYSIALVGLDLSALLRFAQRWPELEELAADTYRRFCELGEDEEALAALKLWLDAAQARTLTEELITEVKETVHGRMEHQSSAGADRHAGLSLRSGH